MKYLHQSPILIGKLYNNCIIVALGLPVVTFMKFGFYIKANFTML